MLIFIFIFIFFLPSLLQSSNSKNRFGPFTRFLFRPKVVCLMFTMIALLNYFDRGAMAAVLTPISAPGILSKDAIDDTHQVPAHYPCLFFSPLFFFQIVFFCANLTLRCLGFDRVDVHRGFHGVQPHLCASWYLDSSLSFSDSSLSIDAIDEHLTLFPHQNLRIRQRTASTASTWSLLASRSGPPRTFSPGTTIHPIANRIIAEI